MRFFTVLTLCAFAALTFYLSRTNNSVSHEAPPLPTSTTAGSTQPNKQKDTSETVNLRQPVVPTSLLEEPSALQQTLLKKVKEGRLNRQEFNLILAYLEQPCSHDDPHLASHAIKNQYLDGLISYSNRQAELGAFLTSLINDSEQHAVMREYAAQFALPWFLKNTTNTQQDTLAAEQEALVDSLFAVVNIPQGALAGTAIMNLAELSQTYPQIDSQKITENALDMVYDQNYSTASRVGAISALQHARGPERQKALKDIVLDETMPPFVRSAAIAASRQIGMADLQLILEKLLANDNTDEFLKRIASINLKKTKIIR